VECVGRLGWVDERTDHLAPDPSTFDDLTRAERAALDGLERGQEWENRYSLEQSTRPRTIGYGLVDSPVLLASRITETFRAWTDSGGNLESVLSRDEPLDSLMFYWLPGSGASAARLYWESFKQIQQTFVSGTH
jgi:hypothetical protein